MIVVAHGSGNGTSEGSFIISYPVANDDPAPTRCIWLVGSDGLGDPGIQARKDRRREGKHRYARKHRALAVKQMLWLAKSVNTAQDRSPGTHARMPGLSAALTGRDFRSREMRAQVEVWVNEGRAGDEVAS